MKTISYADYGAFNVLLKDYLNEDFVWFSTTNTQSNAVKSFDEVKIFHKDELKEDNPELVYILANQKYSMSIFKDGHRTNANWKIASGVMLDCDDGETLETAIKKLDEIKGSYIIVESKNHQKEKKGKITDRFHVLFILNSPITQDSLYKNYARLLIHMLKGDKAVKDLARFFGETPNLKKANRITINNDFKMNFAGVDFGDNEDISLVESVKERPSIKVTAQELFIEQVKNMHPQMMFSHYNQSNGTMNFHRNSKDEGPGVFVYPKSKTIIDPSNDERHPLIFTMNDFNRVVEPDQKAMEEKLKQLIQEINQYNGEKYKIDIIKTNEGTGKSYAVCQLLEKGMFFTANTLDRLKEIEDTLHQLDKDYVVIYSNSNIIYNTILYNRGETLQAKFIAEGVAKKYDVFFKYVFQKTNKNESQLSQEGFVTDAVAEGRMGEHTKKQVLSFIREEMRKAEESQEERNTALEDISIRAFLMSEYADDILETEKDMILETYHEQIDDLKAQDKIYLMTTQKFFFMKKLIANFSKRVRCFQDECLLDIYKNTKVIDKLDREYNFKIALAYSTRNEIEKGTNLFFEGDEEDKRIFNKIQKSDAEFYVAKSYGNFTSLIECTEINWYKEDKFHITILTTEDLPCVIIPDADIYDLSHNIYSPKLTIIGVEGLNSMQKPEYILQGKDRLLFIKQLTMDRFKIDGNMIIANAINQKWNFVNSKGTNKFKDSLQDIDGTAKLGIILTYPHPEQINEKKGFYINELKALAKEEEVPFYDYFNSKACEQWVVSRIINDDLNQALGRVLGYRDTNKISDVIVIMNSSLFSYVETKYITSKVFTYTGLYQSVKKQKENPDIWEYLQKVQLLHLRGKKLSLTEDTKVALRNISAMSINWLKYMIEKIRKLSLKLMYKTRQKVFSRKYLMHRFKVSFRLLYSYFLDNKIFTSRNIEKCVEQQGLLGLLEKQGKSALNFIRSIDQQSFLAAGRLKIL